ncbi:hypothetical protein AAVH_13869 [Aphelenchoides avenae]|nr:hypothetical protein AAVH_13869 [Aphelenchus avenae]
MSTQHRQNQERFETSTTIEVRDERQTVTVEEAERRAHELRKEGEQILQQTDQQMERARKAQAAASAMADQANRITEEALQRQIEGQEKLAQAGQKMMEAAQKMQQESQSISVAEVPYNVHQTSEIRQETLTSGQKIQNLEQNVFVSREAEVISCQDFGGKKLEGGQEFHYKQQEFNRGQQGQDFNKQQQDFRKKEHVKER